MSLLLYHSTYYNFYQNHLSTRSSLSVAFLSEQQLLETDKRLPWLFPFYCLLSPFVTQDEVYSYFYTVYTSIILSATVYIVAAPESACGKNRLADLGARRLITARAALYRRVVSLLRWFRICSLTRGTWRRSRPPSQDRTAAAAVDLAVSVSGA